MTGGLVPSGAPNADPAKAAAAREALRLVRPGMLLGLGTGSTARLFIDGLAGMDVAVVATSVASEQQARHLGLEVREQIDRPLDLAVDGADEVDPSLSLIKGRGGALFREKLVAAAALEFVVIVDESKLVRQLGVGVLPTEVLPFLWRQTAERLERLGCSWTLRAEADRPFVTDNGNLILDLQFAATIEDPEAMGHLIKGVPGVVENGLFCNLATRVIVAGVGGTRTLQP